MTVKLLQIQCLKCKEMFDLKQENYMGFKQKINATMFPKLDIGIDMRVGGKCPHCTFITYYKLDNIEEMVKMILQSQEAMQELENRILKIETALSDKN